MREVLHRLIRRASRKVRRDDMRGDARHDERVAIRRALGDELRSHHPARARAVLDHEALLQLLGELLRDDAPERIGAAAGREGRDDLHRAGRPFLRSKRKARRERRERHHQAFHAPIL